MHVSNIINNLASPLFPKNNEQHLLSAYHVPGTVLNIFNVLTDFILYITI